MTDRDPVPGSDDADLPVFAVDVHGVLRDLLDVARVALGDRMPEPAEAEARALLVALLAVVERTMPPDLQAQDRRVVAARELLRLLDLPRD